MWARHTLSQAQFGEGTQQIRHKLGQAYTKSDIL